MPRKNPVPEREVAICKRVREFRTDLKISQADFARALQMEVSYLSNIEHGRVVLHFRTATAICSAFPINPVWLATGEGPRVSATPNQLPHELAPHSFKYFSEVYDNYLAAFADKKGRFELYGPGDPKEKQSRTRLSVFASLSEALVEWLTRVPDDALGHFEHFALNDVDLIVDKYPKQPKRLVEERRKLIETYLARSHVIKQMDAESAAFDKKIRKKMD